MGGAASRDGAPLTGADGPAFEPDRYVARFLKEADVAQLIQKDNDLITGAYGAWGKEAPADRGLAATQSRQDARRGDEDAGLRELQQVYHCDRHHSEGLSGANCAIFANGRLNRRPIQIKDTVDSMEAEMDGLTAQIEKISQKSTALNDALGERRGKVRQLHGVHSVLQKVIFAAQRSPC